MRRRILVLTLIVALIPLTVLGVQVHLARSGDRLDDETGFRPSDRTVRPGPSPTSVLWLGDSTSTGVGTGSVEESMAHRVAAAASSGPVELTVLGESGAQIHDVLDDQVPELEQRVRAGNTPDLVLVSVGANDVTALTRRPTFRSRYDSLLSELGRIVPAARLVLVGIPDMGTAPRIPSPLRQLTGARAAQLDGVIDDLASSRRAIHVDLAGRTGSIFSSDPDRYFSEDGFHPSADGHRVWADAVVDSIGEVDR